MEQFPSKLKEARMIAGMTQSELGEAAGLSLRAIQTYEQGTKTPRRQNLLALAKVLKVSTTYLTQDWCVEPRQDILMDSCVSEVDEQLGSKAAVDMERLLRENTALFAGGELTQQQKDDYFMALMKAYVSCKTEAQHRYGTKK